jgi:hypothetical protein
MEQLSFCATPGATKGSCTTRAGAVSIVPNASVINSLTFNSVAVGATLSKTITVRNTGISYLLINSVTTSGANVGLFTKTADTCAGASLAQGATCSVTVRFAPDSSGAKVANLAIAHNGTGLVTNVPMTGTGTVPVASLSASSFGFGNRTVLSTITTPITLTNTGNGVLSITGITVTGASFSRVSGCAAGSTVAAGSNCIVTVRFTPQSGGAQNGTLQIADNSGGAPSTQTVTLTGNGTITAVADSNTGTSTNTAAGVVQNIGFAVRANDQPNVAGSVVTIVPGNSSFTNGGATATVSVTGNATTPLVTWSLTPTVPPGTPAAAAAAARQASKRGTYTVTYTLTNGTATSTATYTLTII